MAFMIPLAMAAFGAMDANAKRDDQRRQIKANAEAMKYSPWTGMKPEMMSMSGPSELGGAAQGALSGAMMMDQFKGDSKPAAPPKLGAETSAMQSTMSPWGSMQKKPPNFYGQQNPKEYMLDNSLGYMRS
jgi:hypothetical protein